MNRLVFSVAAMSLLCAGSALAKAAECPPCGPMQCVYNQKELTAAREKLKKRMMRIGQPARLVSPLVDKLSPCAYCLDPEATPGLMLQWVESSKRWRSMPWDARNEWLCRKDLRSGKIKAFYITMWAEACECCTPGSTASSPWVRSTPPQKRRDWDKWLGLNKDLTLQFESVKALGPEPDDLKGMR